jgi:hypothetical protein
MSAPASKEVDDSVCAFRLTKPSKTANEITDIRLKFIIAFIM